MYAVPRWCWPALVPTLLFAGCGERECRGLEDSLLSRYDPYADRCTTGDDCTFGTCDTSATGVCRCEHDAHCSSGLCLSGLCANPGHDRRLTPGLSDPGVRLRPVCQEFLPARRSRNTDPACNEVLALLEADACHVCDEAALLLCACRTGAALHECLVSLAVSRRESGGPPDDEASWILCEDQAAHTECAAHRGPPGSPCGGTAAGPDECLSGACRDRDPENNASPAGDDPRDWLCAEGLRNDN